MYNRLFVSLGYTFPPFYTFGLPKHQNFGGLGFIISHEMGHAFGKTAIDYDQKHGKGKWLSKNVNLEFEKRTSCLSEQYSRFRFDQSVNGTLTLNENLVDNLGIRVAFNAYKKYVEEMGGDKGLKGLEQFSPEQLFFIGYGRGWCKSVTKKGLEKQLLKSHAPSEVRVNGAVRNFEEFSKAFGCPVKDEVDWMNPPPEKKCRVY